MAGSKQLSCFSATNLCCPERFPSNLWQWIDGWKQAIIVLVCNQSLLSRKKNYDERHPLILAYCRWVLFAAGASVVFRKQLGRGATNDTVLVLPEMIIDNRSID
jgi:hypothetical protein